MIISTKRGTPAAELDKIIREFEAKGLSVTMIRGTDYNVFGLVGDTTVIDEKQVRANPYVENVQRVSEPYKKANRLFHEADSIIDVGGIKVGMAAYTYATSAEMSSNLGLSPNLVICVTDWRGGARRGRTNQLSISRHDPCHPDCPACPCPPCPRGAACPREHPVVRAGRRRGRWPG